MIEFRNINFRYAGGTDAGGLVNINLIIPDGQVTAKTQFRKSTRTQRNYLTNPVYLRSTDAIQKC